MRGRVLVRQLALALAGALPDAGLAQPSPRPEVVDTTPVPGLGTPRDEVPSNVQTVTDEELEHQQSSTLTDHLNENVGSVTVNEAQSNAFQPDVLYRGFVASPLLGNPIGLSVYLDGVRVNEQFGDTVNWDLIPTSALSTLHVIPGSNPVFGSNTLGGALVARTRSGDTDPGLRAEAQLGSFDRQRLELAQGGYLGPFDAFVAGELFSEGGWREHSPSRVRRLFSKLGWDDEATDVDLSYTWAHNDLVGNGLAPESILEREGRDAIYTFPDETSPTLHFWNLQASRRFGEDWLLSGNLHHRRLRVGTWNGDAEFDDAGTPADPSDDAVEAEKRRTRTHTRVSGASAQLTRRHGLAGLENRVSAGATVDLGRSRFESFEQAGEFTDERGVRGTGDFELATDLTGRTRNWGIYVVDELALSPRFHVTASARYSVARVELEDESGSEPELDGEHRFGRLAPALGASWAVTPALTLYGGYSEGFRAPTPVELTCADPEDPCTLPVGFVADPPLDEVVARGFELGARGRLVGALGWEATFYRTDLDDDILFIATGGSRGFFANVGETRRQGAELALSGQWKRLSFLAGYAWVDATFQSSEALFNPVSNPADPAQPATIDVRPGDRLPGIPRHSFKLGAEYRVGEDFVLGAHLLWAGSQFMRGDEDNSGPKLDDRAILDLRAEYRVSPGVSLFARLDNVFDSETETLGAWNRNAFDAEGLPIAGELGAVERFVSPGAPRTLFVGVRIELATQPPRQ